MSVYGDLDHFLSYCLYMITSSTLMVWFLSSPSSNLLILSSSPHHPVFHPYLVSSSVVFLILFLILLPYSSLSSAWSWVISVIISLICLPFFLDPRLAFCPFWLQQPTRFPVLSLVLIVFPILFWRFCLRLSWSYAQQVCPLKSDYFSYRYILFLIFCTHISPLSRVVTSCSKYFSLSFT